MVDAGDYRDEPYNLNTLLSSGKYIGSLLYWKLYAIENIMRIAINSVLNVQIGPDWWVNVSNQRIRDHVRLVRNNETNFPQHTPSGSHDIYCIFLTDITNIITRTSHLFLPIIDDIDQWIVRLEDIRTPRNLLGHMNWLNQADSQIIRSTYFEAKRLLRRIENAGITIEIPN